MGLQPFYMNFRKGTFGCVTPLVYQVLFGDVNMGLARREKNQKLRGLTIAAMIIQNAISLSRFHAQLARPCALCQGKPRLASYHHFRASHSRLHSLTIHTLSARPCALCQGWRRLFSYNGYRVHDSVDVNVQQ